MAVIVKYVVVRNGDEKMTFATKKEADAYDKMLDIADNLYEFFEHEALPLDERQKESVSMSLARNKDLILKIMKGMKVRIKTDKLDKEENEDSGVSPATSVPKKQARTEKEKKVGGGSSRGRKTSKKTVKKEQTDSGKGDKAETIDDEKVKTMAAT